MTNIENSKRKSILVVCMLDSIHTARWLSMFSNQNLDFILMPSTPNRKVHPGILKLIQNSTKNSAQFKLSIWMKWLSIPIWVLNRFFSDLISALLVKRFVTRNEVSIIHAIELNHAGYIVAKAWRIGLPKNIKIISTNWGSDIFWFQKYKKHVKKIKQIMEISSSYSAECTRDLELASKYGFIGKFKEVLPNAGGFDPAFMTKKRTLPSSRKVIVIKGYESFVGRASIALAAISELASLLTEYEIYIYSASQKTIRTAKKLSKEHGLKVFPHKKKSLSHSQILEIFERSRVYIGVSLSDGISTSLLESIACGTFPIQTNTSCAKEWLISGQTGVIVEPNSGSVADALRLALENDGLVDSAFWANQKLSEERLDSNKIQAKLSSFYA